MGFIWLIYAVCSVLISLSSFLCLSLYILFSSAFSQLKRLIHQSPNSVLFVLLIGMSKQNVVGCGFSLQRPCSFLHCSSWHFKYHQPNSFFILHCSVLLLSVSTNISIACPVVFQPEKDSLDGCCSEPPLQAPVQPFWSPSRLGLFYLQTAFCIHSAKVRNFSPVKRAENSVWFSTPKLNKQQPHKNPWEKKKPARKKTKTQPACFKSSPGNGLQVHNLFGCFHWVLFHRLGVGAFQSSMYFNEGVGRGRNMVLLPKSLCFFDMLWFICG